MSHGLSDDGIELVEDYTEGAQTTRIWSSADACPSGISLLKPYAMDETVSGGASPGKALWSRTKLLWRSARGYGKGNVAALAPDGRSVASAEGFGSPVVWHPDPEAAGQHGAIYYNAEPRGHSLPPWLPQAADAKQSETPLSPGQRSPDGKGGVQLTREMVRDRKFFETVTCVTFSKCGSFLLTASVIKDRSRGSSVQSAANLWRKVPHDGGGAPESESGDAMRSSAAGWQHVRTFAQTARRKDTGHYITLPAASEGGSSRSVPCTINGACFSANGERIVTVGDDGAAIVWSRDEICSADFTDDFNTRTRLAYGHPRLAHDEEANAGHVDNVRHTGHVGLGKSVSFAMRELTRVNEKQALEQMSPTEQAKTPVHAEASYPITSVAFSSDAIGRILTGGKDGRAVLWRVPVDLPIRELKARYVIDEKNREQEVLEHRLGQRDPDSHRGVTCVAFVAGRRHGAGHKRHDFDTGARWLTGGMDGVVVVWDASTNVIAARLDYGHGSPSASKVNSASFSAHGDFVLSGGSDGCACLWELRTQLVVARMRHTLHKTKRSVTSVAIRETPGGRVLMTAGNDGGVQIYEQPSHQSVRPLGEDFASFRSDMISMSPGGRWIATAHSDRAKPGVCSWDANPMRHERGVTHGVLVCKLETVAYERHRGRSSITKSVHAAMASVREGQEVDSDEDYMEMYDEAANLPWLWGAVQWNSVGDRVVTLGGERGGEGAAQHCWIFEITETSLMACANHARSRRRRGTTGLEKSAVQPLDGLKWEVPLRSRGAHDEAAMVVQCATFCPGGGRLVTGETAAGLAADVSTWLGGRACVWDLLKIEAGEGSAALIAVVNNTDEHGVPRSVRCLAIDVLKSGEQLLVTAGDHGTCSVWDLNKAVETGDGDGALHGRLLEEEEDGVGHHEAASFVAVKFDPLGCGQTQTVRIFTACTDKGCMWEYDVVVGGRGTVTGLFENGHHGKSLTGADFSPHGDRIVTAGEDGFVSYWDAFPPSEHAEAAELLPGRASLAWRDDPGHIGHVHHAQIARLKCKQHRSLRVDFSPDGEYILTGASDMKDGAVALLWPALWNHHELQSDPHIEVCDWSYLERDLGFGPSVGRDNALHAFAARWHSAEDDAESSERSGHAAAVKGLVNELAIVAPEKETEVQRKARRAREERLGAKVRLYTMQFKFWSTSAATRYLPLLNAQGETPMSLAARNHNHDFITTICQRSNLALPPGPQDNAQHSTRMMSAVRTSDLTALLNVQPARVLEVLHDPALIRSVPQWCEHLTVGAETHTFATGRPWEVAGARRGMNEAPSFWARQLASFAERDTGQTTVCTRISRVNRCRRGETLFRLLVPGGPNPKHNKRPPEQTQAYIVALDDIAGDAGERLVARLYEMDNVTLSAFETDIMKALAVFKWRVFAMALYHSRLAYFLVYLVLHTYIAIASRRYDYDYADEEWMKRLGLDHYHDGVIVATTYVLVCTTFDLLSELVSLLRDWKRYIFGSFVGAIQLVRIGATYISFIPILLIAAEVPCYFLGESAVQLYVTAPHIQPRPDTAFAGSPPQYTMLNGEAVAYVTGNCDLWGRTFLAVNDTDWDAFKDSVSRVFTQSGPAHVNGGWIDDPVGYGIFSLYGVLALANILTWAHAPHMTRGLPGLGWFTYLVSESLRDMRPFLTFSVLTLLAFSTGMYILSVGPDECERFNFGLDDWTRHHTWEADQQCNESWIGRGFGGAVMSTIAWIFGNWELTELQQSHNISMSYLFFFGFVLVIAVTCFNLLISILSETYDKAKDTKDRVRHRTYLAIAQESTELIELYMCVNACTRGKKTSPLGKTWQCCHAVRLDEAEEAERRAGRLRRVACCLPRLYLQHIEPYINPPYLHILRPRRYGSAEKQVKLDEEASYRGRLHKLQRDILTHNREVEARLGKRVGDLSTEIERMGATMSEELEKVGEYLLAMNKVLYAKRPGGKRRPSKLGAEDEEEELSANVTERMNAVHAEREKRARNMKENHALMMKRRARKQKEARAKREESSEDAAKKVLKKVLPSEAARKQKEARAKREAEGAAARAPLPPIDAAKKVLKNFKK